MISTLQAVTAVDLRDNRLTDTGIQAVVAAVCSRAQRDVTSLDLSENKLDEGSATALSAFLKDPKCSLQQLRLGTADMDE